MRIGNGLSIPEVAVRQAGAGGPTPPVGCTITLTGDIGPAFGFAAADVTGGNSFSVTNAAANVYLASTPFATAEVRRPLPAPGKRVWIQVDSFSISGGAGTNARGGFTCFDGAGAVIAIAYIRGGSTAGSIVIEDLLGNTLASRPLFNLSYGSLGIDADGELYVYYPLEPATIIKMSDLDPAFSGPLAGTMTLVAMGALDLSGGGPASAGGRIVTNQADMTDRAALVGDEDWCQNTIS